MRMPQLLGSLLTAAALSSPASSEAQGQDLPIPKRPTFAQYQAEHDREMSLSKLKAAAAKQFQPPTEERLTKLLGELQAYAQYPPEDFLLRFYEAYSYLGSPLAKRLSGPIMETLPNGEMIQAARAIENKWLAGNIELFGIKIEFSPRAELEGLHKPRINTNGSNEAPSKDLKHTLELTGLMLAMLSGFALREKAK